jgi:hypothetical protein
MKKFLSILLTLIVSLCCFAACGGDDPLLNGGLTGSSTSNDTGSSTGGGEVIPTYTITYVLTDGLGAMEGEAVQEVKLGETFTLNKLSRGDDYTGYWTTEDGVEFKAGVWTLEENVTLYSKWSANWTGIY